MAVKIRQLTAKSHAHAVNDLWPDAKPQRWLFSLSFNIARKF
jgi:hypothetical protein